MENISFKELVFTKYTRKYDEDIEYAIVPGSFIFKTINTETGNVRFFYAKTINDFLENLKKEKEKFFFDNYEALEKKFLRSSYL